MNYTEFKKIIEATLVSDGLEYTYAVCWLHPERLPVMIESLNGCTDKKIKIAESIINRHGIRVPVVRVGGSAFRNCTTVTDIILSSRIDRIDAGAFNGCTALERIYIPKGVKRIPPNTFAGCTALKDIYYEGTPEEWDRMDKSTERLEFDYGELIPGTPVQELVSERLVRITGNEAISLANIHFFCAL